MTLPDADSQPISTGHHMMINHYSDYHTIFRHSTGRKVICALVAIGISIMSMGLCALTATAAQVGAGASSDSTESANSIGTDVVTSVRSFPSADRTRTDLFADGDSANDADGDYSAASRGASRESLSSSTNADGGSWGGIEDLKIPYSKSTGQTTASDALRSSMENAKSLYDASGDLSDPSHRSALKTLIDEADALRSNAQATEPQLSTMKSKLDAASDIVQTDIQNHQIEQAATAEAPSSNTGGSGTSMGYSPTGSSTGGAVIVKAASGRTAADVAAYATQFVGRVPYVWAGSSLSGWDCSGFVMYVYSQFGVTLPHYSGAQATMGQGVSSLSEAKPGDVIANGTHAAIYIGNGMVVNALNPTEGTTITPVRWAFTSAYQIRRMIA